MLESSPLLYLTRSQFSDPEINAPEEVPDRIATRWQIMNLAAMGDGSTAIAVPLKCAATKLNAPWLTPMSNRQH